MKNLKYLFFSVIIGFAVIITGSQVTLAQDVVVGSDIKLGEPIKQFDSYGWVSNIDQIPTDELFVGPGGVMVLNNVSTRSQVKDAIEYELSARGFKKDSSNPDMLIDFNIFEKSGRLNTYNGYQEISGGLDSVRTEDNATTVTIDPGTLFIAITGTKSQGIVWQGYASGILTKESIQNPQKVKSAVQRIFNRFDYKAFKE